MNQDVSSDMKPEVRNVGGPEGPVHNGTPFP